MGEPTPTRENPSIGDTRHVQDQQDSLQVGDPIIVDSPSPVTPTESYPLPLSLQKRRLSRNQGLHVRTDISTPGRPSLVLSPTPHTQPRQNSTASTASLDHLSPPIDGRTHRSLSAYFSELQGPSSYDVQQYDSPTSSTLPSPALSAMIDITPLPSPINSSFGSARWSIGGSRRRSSAGARSMQEDAARKNSLTFGRGSPRKGKNYGGLLPAAVEGAAAHLGQAQLRDEGAPRSVSDFVPEALHNVRNRVVTLGSGPEDVRPSGGMHREEYIAGKRGLVRDESKHLPSPPASNASAMDSEMDEDDDQFTEHGVDYFRAITIPDGRARRWRSIKVIGKGTFSKVFLATSQAVPPGSFDEAQLDPSKLVAVKISEHGPAGGADEQRIKHSLDRELAILRSISHPSIVRLLAINEQSPQRTELVMSYSRGGDLFEFASQERTLLRPELVQRFFAELVDAVSYLHSQLIVHRDIKLESTSSPLPSLPSLTVPRRPRQPPDLPALCRRPTSPPIPPHPAHHPHRPRSLPPHPPSPSLAAPDHPLRQRRLRRPRAAPRPALRRPRH